MTTKNKKSTEVVAFWESEKLVKEIEVTEKKKIVVKRVAKNEKEYVDVRQTFMDKTGEWKFGKGTAIPVEHADAVAKAIKLALK